MKKAFFILFTLFGFNALGQINNNWIPFSYKKDVSEYRGGKFLLEGYAKIDDTSNYSQARFWARIDNNSKIVFFDNMSDRPIIDDKWKKYLIEGDIPSDSDSLYFGGICMGFGECHFDDFSLKLKTKKGSFKVSPIYNSDFEDTLLFKNWNYLQKEGYKWSLDSINKHNGIYSLSINGNNRSKYNFGNNSNSGNYANVNDIKLYYEIYGNGPPILLIHGNSESINSFKFQIPELSKYFKVIAVDSRGHGKSNENGKKLTYELMAEDISQLIDYLDLNEVNILGWSDGGNIGLILAMTNPNKIRSLSIMGANLFNDSTSVVANVNDQLINYKSKMENENNPNLHFKLELLNLLLNEPNIDTKDLNKINCPTLVMAGENDVIKEAHTKLISKNIKNSRLVIFKNGTHYEPQENPSRFNKTIIEFIKSNN